MHGHRRNPYSWPGILASCSVKPFVPRWSMQRMCFTFNCNNPACTLYVEIYRCSCVVLLLLPQFFSKRGRQALVAYAFILALTGPVKNTLHNTGVLSESLTCVQVCCHFPSLHSLVVVIEQTSSLIIFAIDRHRGIEETISLSRNS